MKPLHIKIRLNTPLFISNDYLMHIDGLLSGLSAQELARSGAADPWNEALDLSSYLDQHVDASGAVWKASMLLPAYEGDPEWWAFTRRNDPLIFKRAMEDGVLKGSRGGINLRSGSTRNFYVEFPYRWASHVEGWAIGDPELLQEILNTATAIGPHRRNGFGRVAGVDITPDDRAIELWKFRVLPPAVMGMEGVTYADVAHNLQPPYWNKPNRSIAKMPILGPEVTQHCSAA